jgi:hypothetical protein
MRKTSASFKLSAGLCGCLLLPQVGLAQATNPARAATATATAPITELGSADRTFLRTAMEQLMSPEQSGAIDPSAGTLTWRGRTFDLGNVRVFRARFERYLNLSAADVERYEAYRGKLGEVADLLSPRHQLDPNTNFGDNIEQAYRVLFEASEFDFDGGNSRVLAGMIYNSWRMRDEIRADNQQLSAWRRERDTLEEGIDRAGRIRAQESEARAQSMRREEFDRAQRAQAAAAGGNVMGGSTDERRLVRKEALLESYQANTAIKANVAKFQFQSQILYFLLQRRFEHALMAADFYRALFRGSAQQVEVGTELLAQFIPKADLVPTVDTLEQIAREAINDTGGNMEAIRNAVLSRDLMGALERLQEAFHLGEFLGPVTTFSEEDRKTILRLYRLKNQARDLLDLRDFDRVLAIVRQIETMTEDFTASSIESYAQSAMRSSSLQVMAAKHALASNDFARAESALGEAAKLWPLNPALNEFSSSMAQQSDMFFQGAPMFDSAYETGNFRALFEKRNELAISLLNDPERSRKLGEAVDRVARVDLLLMQARELLAQNNAYGAWELVAAAEALDPRDAQMVSLKSEALPRAAPFVEALRSARRHETQGNWAVALAHYQVALDLYPASRTAREGLDRSSSNVMAGLVPIETGK